MSTQPIRRVILDKSFLQAEGRNGERLCLLRDCGASFVLTDTLLYEFGTDARAPQWPAAQRKLFHIADNVEVWHHTADLLRIEIEQQRPVKSPVDRDATQRVREWFRGGDIYVPPNLATIGQEAHQQREVDSIKSLVSDCRDLCQKDPTYTARIQRGGIEAEALLSDLMARHEFIAWRVRSDHGKPTDTELYIQGAEEGLGPEWFAYQHAKSTLALCCHYMAKYGATNASGVDFVHTKLDAEYVALLYYADALATNETSGSLAAICRWMHGKSKIILSTSSLDKARPTDDEIRVQAYHQWEREGRIHGHDQDDWYWAKAELLWQRANIYP